MITPATPTQIIHAAAGSPDSGRGAVIERQGVCLVCGGGLTRGVHVKDAISDTDNDRAFFRAPWSDLACEGCAWTGARKPPDTFRMYSVLWRESGGLGDHCKAWAKATTPYDGGEEQEKDEDDEEEEDAPKVSKKAKKRAIGHVAGPNLALLPQSGHTCLTNKGLMAPLVGLLCDAQAGPWFAAIAETGNIHTLRASQVNAGGAGPWCVRMERMDVRCTPSGFERVASWCAELLGRGHVRTLLAQGEPTPSVLMCEGDVDVWLEAVGEIGELWTSAIHALAMFVITKETEDGLRARWAQARGREPQSRARDAASDGGGCDPRVAGVRRSREDGRRDALLADSPQGDPSVIGELADVGAVAGGHVDHAQDRAGARRTIQLDLFGG